MEEKGTGKKNRQGSEKRKKSILVAFRTEEAEKAEIDEAAEAAGLTVGSYCRAIILKKVLTTPRKKPSLDRVLLSQLVGQLGKVGSNLNQMARRLNEGKGAGSERITAACGDVANLKVELLKAIRRLDYDNQGQVKSERGTVGGLPLNSGQE